jgi:predicted CopG family antitoxin
MAKGRNTRVVAIRILDTVYTMLEKRAKKKGLSVSDYIKWDLTRKH